MVSPLFDTIVPFLLFLFHFFFSGISGRSYRKTEISCPVGIGITRGGRNGCILMAAGTSRGLRVSFQGGIGYRRGRLHGAQVDRNGIRPFRVICRVG